MPKQEPVVPATDPTTDQPATDPKPTDTVEFWKAQARENEKRAKANADAATRLAEIEESQKTEAQRLTDAKTAAEAETATARTEALRWRIAAKHGISDEDADTFLTGTDEESLTKQAERLTALAKTGEPTPGPRPDLSQGSHTGTPSASPAQDFANFMTGQLNKS